MAIVYEKADQIDIEKISELTNENGLSKDNFLVPEVYKELFFDNYKYFILSSGRVSGKTSILVAMWWVYRNTYPDKDIVILQATSTEIKGSIINEIKKFLKRSDFDVGDEPNNEWYIPKSQDKIINKSQRGGTYFIPITDSKGGQRSRGTVTDNDISLILYEEAQKNKDANVINQSIITFVRHVKNGAKLVIVGNNETAGHWFIDFVNEKRQDPDWCYIYANCYNIWGWLNDTTKSFIENFKKANYTEFRRVFLGDIHATTSDIVFPQFSRTRHYKKAYELEQHFISFLSIGIDHATANDTFAVVPVAILDDGTTQTLEICYDDPKETGRTLALTEQCEMLEDFLTFLDEKYGISYNQLQTVLSIDGASAPFKRQLIHTKAVTKNKELWRYIQIKSFTKKKKEANMSIIKNAFAYDVLTILNEGATMWDGSPNKHRLVKEIEKQRYKNGQLNKLIENDLCDALEYGLVPYYTNCFNLSFPIRKADYKESSHYNDIRKMYGIKK